MFHQETELPDDSGRQLSYIDFTDKTKWLLPGSSPFYVFSVLNRVFTYRHSKSLFTNDYKFGISVNKYQQYTF